MKNTTMRCLLIVSAVSFWSTSDTYADARTQEVSDHFHWAWGQGIQDARSDETYTALATYLWGDLTFGPFLEKLKPVLDAPLGSNQAKAAVGEFLKIETERLWTKKAFMILMNKQDHNAMAQDVYERHWAEVGSEKFMLDLLVAAPAGPPPWGAVDEDLNWQTREFPICSAAAQALWGSGLENPRVQIAALFCLMVGQTKSDMGRVHYRQGIVADRARFMMSLQKALEFNTSLERGRAGLADLLKQALSGSLGKQSIIGRRDW